MERALDKVSETLLMGPGPSMTYPSVYQAMAKPTLGHMVFPARKPFPSLTT